MWFQKHKWKILGPVLGLAILAGAFYIGGDTPGSKGWTVEDDAPAAVSQPEQTMEPVQAEPSEEAEKALEPVSTPEAETTPVSEGEVNDEPVPDQTDPVPEGQPQPVEPQEATVGGGTYTCTISINCATILDNLDDCDPAKVELIPEGGWVLEPTTVTFYEGESVFNVLQRVCKQQKIHMEYEDTPIYNSAYIEGIHNLYEFDVGEQSGWMYKVNGWFPNYGCSRYQLQDGDEICWVYTCDLGHDVGGGGTVGGNARTEEAE